MKKNNASVVKSCEQPANEARCSLATGSARLANDIARCNGSGSIEDGVQYWREGCEHCLRRTAARPELVWMMAPPPIIAFECEYFLPPNGEYEPRPSNTSKLYQ